MRLNIKKIIELLGCSEHFAKKVEYEIECTDFDFSEATDAEFSVAVNYAVFELNVAEFIVKK